MEKQLNEINKQIEKAYADKNKNPYHLHGICIHDGTAASGHYYAFIKDHFQNKWRRFNDVRVTEVTEEDVFTEANGGNGQMTAYWVVYVNQELAQEISGIDLYKYSVPNESSSDEAINS